MKQKLIKMLSILGMSDYIRRVFSKKFKKLVASPYGISALVVAISLPIIIYGTTYLIKYTKKSVVETNNFEIPYVIGKKLAQSYNPGKNWDKQKDYLYSVAAQIYNDGAFTSRLDHKKTIKAVAEPGNIELGEKKTIKSLCHYYETYSSHGGHNNWSPDNMLTNCPPFANFVYENGNKIAYLKSVQKDGASEEDVVAYVVNEYKEDSDKLEISHSENDGDRKISVTCKGLKKKMEITLPRNDADIILAIPTNQKSNEISEKENEPSIRHIARASQAFLKYFLHTVGVAAGIVPYSGKVSISPARAESATTEILLNDNPNSGLTYVVQSVFYGSDGNMGGEIVHRSGEDNKKIYDWGDSTLGWPIMARRGQQLPYRNDMSLNSGAISKKTGSDSLLLDMTTSPNTDDYKFMQMNTNPCYLGFCNTLAMTCEKDCPTYMANPYFMTELTSDIQGLIYDLELFIPFKDEHNKSNFLFLPFVMAGNLFSWGNHPSDLNEQEVSRTKKKRYVIIIANAPDNFEPQEMTYLGFNNDYSEIPMFESDTILFTQDQGYVEVEAEENKIYTGAKGAVRFKTSYGSLTSDGYLFSETTSSATARISFPNKAMLKIVTEGKKPGEVEIYNDNGVVDNVGTHKLEDKEKRFYFRGPEQVKDWSDLGTKFTSENYTTKGPNFGHNLSVKKVKIKMSKCRLKRAILWNQILRFYGSYSAINDKELIENTSGSVGSLAGGASMSTEMIGRMDPCIYVEGTSTATDGWSFESAGDRTDTCTVFEDKVKCNCYRKLIWNNTGSGWESSTQYEDVCDSCWRYLEEACTKPKASISSGYYIGANDFSIICRGVAFTKFLFAADNFRKDEGSTVQLGDAAITTLTEGGGSVAYDTSKGVKYKSFQHKKNSTKSVEKTIARKAKIGDTEYNRPYTMLFGTSPSDGKLDYSKSHTQQITDEVFYYNEYGSPIDKYGRATIKFNQNTIKSYNYYMSFANKKKRSRTVKHKITTKREYYATSSGDPGDYPNTPCCSEVWEIDNCKNTVDSTTSCEEYTTEKVLSGYTDCTEECTRNKGEREGKGALGIGGLFGSYWCGKKTKTCTADSEKKCIEDYKDFKCTNEDGDDMSKDDWNCKTYCRADKAVYDNVTKCAKWAKECVPGRSNTGRYNDNVNKCTGMNWTPGPETGSGSVSGWEKSTNNKSVKCNTLSATATFETTYTYPQSQDSISCKILEGSLYGSSCTYYIIDEPYSSSLKQCKYEYANCSSGTSTCTRKLNYDTSKDGDHPLCRSGEEWTQTQTEKKLLYAFYQRNIDGSTQFPTYKICETGGVDCTEITPSANTVLEYSAGLRKSGKVSSSTPTSTRFRFNMYNFFFVNMDGDKRTTYYYNDDGTFKEATFSSTTEFLTGGLVDAESHKYLLYNVGPLLLPTEEDNIYWVCFCGDADLWLDIEDNPDSLVTFSNIIHTNDVDNTSEVEVNYTNDERIFYIHPSQISDTLDDDGNYYVDLTITGETRIRSIELTNRPLKETNSAQYYAHPDIIGDGLTNTRIIDSPQQENALLTAYGKINHSSESPKVSSVQGLFYSEESGNVFIYPNSKADKAEVGEEGDFFIQLWDYGNLVPTVKWKIGSDQNPADKDIDTTDFGKFKSNYAFSGLHRMFFPYTTYNKNWGGYSGSTNIALVFAGYTLPINCILASNGYQNVFKVDDSSEPIKPNDALQNLAKDACTKLKGLTTDEGAPEIFLVKYKADFTYLDECVENKYSATNEEELTAVMEAIAQYIDSQTSELRVDVTDT